MIHMRERPLTACAALSRTLLNPLLSFSGYNTRVIPCLHRLRRTIMKVHDILTRRQLLMAGSLGAAAWLVPGVFADELMRTPAMTEGPFYPDRLPLDTDNDLVIVGNSTTPAVGEITHLTGRVLDLKGNPVKDATVEI